MSVYIVFIHRVIGFEFLPAWMYLIWNEHWPYLGYIYSPTESNECAACECVRLYFVVIFRLKCILVYQYALYIYIYILYIWNLDGDS